MKHAAQETEFNALSHAGTQVRKDGRPPGNQRVRRLFSGTKRNDNVVRQTGQTGFFVFEKEATAFYSRLQPCESHSRPTMRCSFVAEVDFGGSLRGRWHCGRGSVRVGERCACVSTKPCVSVSTNFGQVGYFCCCSLKSPLIFQGHRCLLGY